MHDKAAAPYGLIALLLLWMPWMAPAGTQAAEIVVSSATPSSAEQGTVGLLVTIKGSGFPKKPQVRFCRTDTGTGTCDPDRITVTSAAGKGTTTIEATIDIAPDASATSFDVEVIEPLSGRKGRGTGLFSVQVKSTDASIEVPLGSFDPDFSFSAAGIAGVGQLGGTLWSRALSGTETGVVSWSPNGEWLLLNESYTVGNRKNRFAERLTARRVDGSGITENLLGEHLYGSWSSNLGNGRQYLFYDKGRLEPGTVYARELGCSYTNCTLGAEQVFVLDSDLTFWAMVVDPTGRFLLAQSSNEAARLAGASRETYLGMHLLRIGFDADQNLHLSQPIDLTLPFEALAAAPLPIVSAAYPDQVLYTLCCFPAQGNPRLESITYDQDGNPVSRQVIREFDVGPDTRVFADVSARGEVLYYRNEPSSSFDPAEGLYLLRPGEISASRIPYGKSPITQSPRWRPQIE